tara:strand:- start:189 stop:611 length:423 start_codon:yes stop_codon:yes gene_type:complete
MADVQLTEHARKRMKERGWTRDDVLMAIACKSPLVVTHEIIKVITVLPKCNQITKQTNSPPKKKVTPPTPPKKKKKKKKKQAAQKNNKVTPPKKKQKKQAQNNVKVREHISMMQQRAEAEAMALEVEFERLCRQFNLLDV